MSFLYNNFGVSQLNTVLAIAGLTANIPPADASLFPAAASVADPVPIILFDRDRVQAPEIIYITNNPVDGSFTIIRAQESTTAQDWPIGTVFMCSITAAVVADLQLDLTNFALKDMSNVDALSIGGGLIQSNAISTAKIQDTSINNAKLGVDAVENANINGGAVTQSEISNGAISNSKLQTDSVDTANIVDDAITRNKLEDVEKSVIGEVIWRASANIPTGWLECNGQAVSRTTYSSLFSQLSTTWGVGDGSTTFNLPDLQDHGIIGENTGRLTGTTRAAANKSHSHTVPTYAGAGGAAGVVADVTTAFVGDEDTSVEGEVNVWLVGGQARRMFPLIKW